MPPAAAPMDSRMRRAAQNWNSAGVSSFFRVLGPDRRLILPHVSVPDIRWLDWAALRDAGFRGCVFDKDNTLTEPFSLEVRHELRPALEECLAVFQPLSGVALLSNSAGLAQYDPEGTGLPASSIPSVSLHSTYVLYSMNYLTASLPSRCDLLHCTALIAVHAQATRPRPWRLPWASG